ncbi:MAG: methyltransferase, partial [Spirochaetales bacterium]|nr:methyltransferase [Spirochaetales bacterium]
GSNPSSGISAIAHDNLMNHLDWSNESTLIYDVVQQLAQPGEKLIDLLGVDVIDIGRAFNTSDSDWKGVEMANGRTGYYPVWFNPVKDEKGSWNAFHNDGTRIATMPEGSTFFDETCFPFVDGYPESRAAMDEALDEAMDKVLWQSLVHSPWDHASESDFWEKLRKGALHLRNTTDKALMIVFGGNLFEWGTFIRRMDNFLMDLYIDRENSAILMELLMERHMKTLEKVCSTVGDVVDIIRFGDGLGMDSGPFMGIDIYRELFHSYRKQMSDYVHKNSSMHTFIHSCGSIYQYIPDLIEEGIEIINPVQTNCHDMDPARLKKEFGKEIVFWGGSMDPREIFNHGTPVKVKEETIRRMQIFAPGGGFVVNNIHNIMPDVPPENILAFYKAAREFKL